MAMSGHPAEDFLRPKLGELIRVAQAAGFAPDVTVAVLLELLDEPGLTGDAVSSAEGSDGTR